LVGPGTLHAQGAEQASLVRDHRRAGDRDDCRRTAAGDAGGHDSDQRPRHHRRRAILDRGGGRDYWRQVQRGRHQCRDPEACRPDDDDDRSARPDGDPRARRRSPARRGRRARRGSLRRAQPRRHPRRRRRSREAEPPRRRHRVEQRLARGAVEGGPPAVPGRPGCGIAGEPGRPRARRPRVHPQLRGAAEMEHHQRDAAAAGRTDHPRCEGRTERRADRSCQGPRSAAPGTAADDRDAHRAAQETERRRPDEHSLSRRADRAVPPARGDEAPRSADDPRWRRSG